MKTPAAPFKFLDAYVQQDREVFFGREKETEDLYNDLSGVKHLLVYGPSGAGKTSLVECGLRNQFSDADWFALTLRRGNDINVALFSAINTALNKKIDLDADTGLPINSALNFGEAIERLFAERYQPVYLLFDQFEELLILGDEHEKKDFFERLNQLMRYKVACRVILVMREEFIGHLTEYEPVCPSIFQNRYRLEKMRSLNVRYVITKILGASTYWAYFDVEQLENLVDAMLPKLPDKWHEIELAHVQVYLSRLWSRALEEQNGRPKPLLHPGLVKETDNLETVLDLFLKIQLEELGKEYGEKVPIEVLACMISERNTKKQLVPEELEKELEEKQVQLKKPLNGLLKDLETRRIIRSLKPGYEISHDLLAFLVGQNLTEDMRKRARAREIYAVLEQKEGFLSLEDLKLLASYQPYHTPAIQQRIKESEVHIENLKQKQVQAYRKRLRMVAGLLVLVVLGLLAAIYFAVSANTQKKEATRQKEEAVKQKDMTDNALTQFKKEQAAKDSIQFIILEGRANIIWPDGGSPVEILEDMKQISIAHPGDLWMKTKIDFIKIKCPQCK